MRILLARHGKTEQNIKDIIQDENSSLSEEGIAQLSKLIERLKKEDVRLIISSDFERARKSAELISKSLKVKVEYSTLLREKYDGDWIGKSCKEVNWDGLEGGFEDRRAPKGENLLEVRERARDFFKKLAEEHLDEKGTILVISHSTFLRVLLGDLIGTSLKDAIFKLSLDNCSLTEISVSPSERKGYRIGYINDKSFLSG